MECGGLPAYDSNCKVMVVMVVMVYECTARKPMANHPIFVEKRYCSVSGIDCWNSGLEKRRNNVGVIGSITFCELMEKYKVGLKHSAIYRNLNKLRQTFGFLY